MAADKPADIFVAYLILVATLYGVGRDMTIEAVGRKFYGNSGFFPALQAKDRRSISIDKFFEMLGGMKADWPAQIPWPEIPAFTITPSQ